MAEDAPFRFAEGIDGHLFLREEIGPRLLRLEDDELSGIREVLLDLLSGGEPTDDTVEHHKRWGYVVRLLLAGLNRENGTIQTMPGPDGLLAQGHLTMQAYQLTQEMFIAHVNQKTEEKASKPRITR